MRKIAKIMLFLVLTSCSTQELALKDNWEECMNCGKHFIRFSEDNIIMKRIIIKIEDKDVRKGNPFWQFSRFKRVHKSKKTYNRKKKHRNSDG